jgi:hypothetical protein
MPLIKRTIKERLLSKIRIDPETGCWEWTASCHQGGYGSIKIRVDGIAYTRLAHRVSYQEFKGPIPDGLELDHLCHDPDRCAGGKNCPHRRCINPDHLEPVTTQVNLLRGGTFQARNSKITRCPYGHAYEGRNLIVYNKQRCCRACLNRRALIRYHKNKSSR